MPFPGDREMEPMGEGQSGEWSETSCRCCLGRLHPDSACPHSASVADPMDITLGSPHQRELMELACGSSQERGLG
jgi:hypothetical protein